MARSRRNTVTRPYAPAAQAVSIREHAELPGDHDRATQPNHLLRQLYNADFVRRKLPRSRAFGPFRSPSSAHSCYGGGLVGVTVHPRGRKRSVELSPMSSVALGYPRRFVIRVACGPVRCAICLGPLDMRRVRPCAPMPPGKWRPMPAGGDREPTNSACSLASRTL
jgi:hypothetical protein